MDNCFDDQMVHRFRIDCTIEIEVEDLPPHAARSVEELRGDGARLSAITDRARTAIETAPGVTLLMWGEMVGSIEDDAH